MGYLHTIKKKKLYYSFLLLKTNSFNALHFILNIPFTLLKPAETYQQRIRLDTSLRKSPCVQQANIREDTKNIGFDAVQCTGRMIHDMEGTLCPQIQMFLQDSDSRIP